MRLKYLPLLLLALLTAPFLTSCHKDKDEAEPSKALLLVAHDWQGDQVLVMGVNVTESGAIRQDIPDIRTLLLTFNADNTYRATTEDLTFEGDWRLNEDETKIDFDFLGLGEVDIKTLDEEHLNLRTSVTKGQLALVAQILNVDLGILNNLPDETEIETEIRFVKP